MKIAITGGTGFVGKELTDLLLQKGHEVYILSRSKQGKERGITYVQWLSENANPEKQLEGVDAVVNLAGESINNGRWTEKQKRKIYDSRMESTDEVLRILHVLTVKPKVLVNASAIGIYPASTSRRYTDKSKEFGTDFLARTVRDWELKAQGAEKLNIRVACGRFGIILGKSEGALSLMAMPYKLFVGGPVGGGDNWMSWVHVKDVANVLLFAIEHPINGPFNITAPHAKKMKDFGKTLATILKRPNYFPVPSFALKLVLGEKSQLVLEGQHVIPQVLLDEGYTFQFPNLESALLDIYK